MKVRYVTRGVTITGRLKLVETNNEQDGYVLSDFVAKSEIFEGVCNMHFGSLSHLKNW